MARYQIQNKVNTIEDLKSFNQNGYYFSSEMSKDNGLVFIREAQ